MRRLVLSFSLAAAAAVAAMAMPAAPEPVFVESAGLSSIAIRGADPVAYFTEGRAVTGSAEFAADWRGATWRFASAANRDAFLAAPERYAPAYGGFCAWAVAHGYTAPVDPEAWSIVDGRLFLNYSISVRAQWEPDKDALIVRGDANWPGLSAALANG